VLLKNIIIGVYTVVCLFLVIIILLQQSKDRGLSHSVVGNAETFFSKNRVNTNNVVLSRITMVFATLFLLLSMIIPLIV